MTTEYALYLESGPKRRKTMVHVFDLLGCVAVGPTTEAALDATPPAIRSYLGFLRRCGEAVDPAAPFTTRVEEHIMEGEWLGNGSPYVMFGPDKKPVTAAELEVFLQRFQSMRDLLADWAERQPEASLDGGTDEGRANGAILMHVLGTPGAYISPLVGGIPGHSRIRTATERGELSIAEGLRQMAVLVVDALRASTDAQRSEVVVDGKQGRSLRKGIRRMLEHDWEHIAELARRPGGPQV